MSLIHDVLTILADGDRHSGVELAARLGVTRAAISKAVAGLDEVPILVDRKGYSLPASFRPLNEHRIQKFLRARGCALDGLRLLEEVDSTNRVLLREAFAGVWACVAERQSAGRGRRGRSWQATPYGNVMLSVGFNFHGLGHGLGALSLGAGVAVNRALRALGVNDAGLKWPNDVLWRARKLAGILIEMRGEPDNMRVVIGVGLNGYLGPKAGAAINQPWVDLRTLLPIVDRDQVVALLIAELVNVVAIYQDGGVGGLLDEWRMHHVFAGLPVSVSEGDGPGFVGTVVDVDSEGSLILMAEGCARVVRSGEVSVRALV